jgi:hypothetical protein
MADAPPPNSAGRPAQKHAFGSACACCPIIQPITARSVSELSVSVTACYIAVSLTRRPAPLAAKPPSIGSLVEELARLDRHRLRESVEAAQHLRQKRIRQAVQKVRQSLLLDWKTRPAARAIDDAVRGRRASFRGNPALGKQIEHQLRQELGSLDDISGAERIRQLLNS